MTVPSSVLVSPGVKTRSKAPRCGVAMITEIPLLAKLYKLLILELGDIIENQTAAADIDETLDDDDDEESDDESEGDQPDVNANVSSKEASLQAVITGLAGGM